MICFVELWVAGLVKYIFVYGAVLLVANKGFTCLPYNSDPSLSSLSDNPPMILQGKLARSTIQEPPGWKSIHAKSNKEMFQLIQLLFDQI